MGCVIRLPDDQCEAPSTDVLGIGGDFVGYAGKVVEDPTLPPNSAVGSGTLDLKDMPIADVGREKVEVNIAVNPTIDVLITAAEMTVAAVPEFTPTLMIPAKRLAEFYRDAVIAEMHETVKSVTNIKIDWLKPGEEFGDGKRAHVHVSARHLSGMSIEGARYMFELRDAVEQVIRDFVPPSEAWVAIEATDATPQGDPPMGDTIKEIESVIEEITNTTDPIASVGVLVDWVAVMLNKVSASSTPSHAAVDLSGALLTHKDALATAVVANTQTPGGVTDMPPAGGDGGDFSQSAQHG